MYVRVFLFVCEVVFLCAVMWLQNYLFFPIILHWFGFCLLRASNINFTHKEKARDEFIYIYIYSKYRVPLCKNYGFQLALYGTNSY